MQLQHLCSDLAAVVVTAFIPALVFSSCTDDGFCSASDAVDPVITVSHCDGIKANSKLSVCFVGFFLV